jgi:hypothetical protein
MVMTSLLDYRWMDCRVGAWRIGEEKEWTIRSDETQGGNVDSKI